MADCLEGLAKCPEAKGMREMKIKLTNARIFLIAVF